MLSKYLQNQVRIPECGFWGQSAQAACDLSHILRSKESFQGGDVASQPDQLLFLMAPSLSHWQRKLGRSRANLARPPPTPNTHKYPIGRLFHLVPFPNRCQSQIHTLSAGSQWAVLVGGEGVKLILPLPLPMVLAGLQQSKDKHRGFGFIGRHPECAGM